LLYAPLKYFNNFIGTGFASTEKSYNFFSINFFLLSLVLL
jgi:hypothetical protein